jgi:hypothetical protein
MMPNLGFIFPLLQAAPNPAGTPLPSKNILSNRASGHMHYYIFTECGQPKEENRQFFVSVSDSVQEVHTCYSFLDHRARNPCFKLHNFTLNGGFSSHLNVKMLKSTMHKTVEDQPITHICLPMNIDAMQSVLRDARSTMPRF